MPVVKSSTRNSTLQMKLCFILLYRFLRRGLCECKTTGSTDDR